MMEHKSYDKSTMETHYDRFDIDFIRYTRLPNILFNILGTVIMMSVLLSSKIILNTFMSMQLNLLMAIALIGGFIFFMILVTIARRAGAADASRLAARRGLFSYCIMTIIIVLFFVTSGSVGLTTLFGYTLRMILSAQIFCALLAVPFDYCSTMLYFKK